MTDNKASPTAESASAKGRLPFFESQIFNASLFRAFANVSYDVLKSAVELYFEHQSEESAKALEAKGGSPLLVTVTRVFGGANAALAHKRQLEIVTRAAYVYAWAAFESLMEWCVETLTRWRPQQTVERHKGAAVELLGHVASGTMSREQLLSDLVSRELKALRSKSFNDQREQIMRWHVEWPDESYLDLARVADRRNKAAHEWEFVVPTEAEIGEDMVALIYRGRLLADAVLKRVGEHKASE